MQLTKNITPKHIVLAKQIKTKQAKILKTVLEKSSLPSPKAKRSVKSLKLAMVNAALFQYKDIEVFAISIQNLKYQLNKTEKLVTDSAIMVPEYYHDFLDVFSKKTLDKILLHLKYDHKIKLLEKGKDYGQMAL